MPRRAALRFPAPPRTVSVSRRLPPIALWTVLATVLLANGCAGLPRIDPSGRRFLIWPNADTAANSAPSLPSLPSLGNVPVPPVFAGQTTVQPPEPANSPFVTAPPATVGGTPVAVPAIPGQIRQQVASPVTETLKITPTRLLAPVGSEVILKAGVCAPNGYLRTNRRIEWMVGQQGTGQFVTVGEQGEMDVLRFPWQRPNKFDNSYAVGYTTPFHVCLRRGTEDASDDVQVERGEAWITLTSASEGVSYITASAPESTNWDARRAVATVYWVDAQWRLPPPQSLQPGQTGTLTTTVTRQTDGAPVAGWLVRYEVLRGETARLGYESGQASEVTTDAQGRANLQISPTDDMPGSAQVRVTVIRPAMSAPMPSPRLEVGGGETTVTWSPAAIIPVLPPAGDTVDDGFGGGPPPRPFEPPPTNDDGVPLGEPLPGIGPRIELVLKRDSVGPVAVGTAIPVTVELLNTGDAIAQNLSLTAEYDRGLSSPQDTQGLYRLQYPSSRLPALGPGDSSVVELDFVAAQPGEQCYSVTVGADGMANAFDRQCVNVERPAPPARPQLRIETALNAQSEVGQTLRYIVTVVNDASTSADNVRVEVLSDPSLEVTGAEPVAGRQAIPKGLAWDGQRIEPGGRLRFDVEFRCLTATAEAKVTTYVLLSESDYEQKTDAVEVLPAQAEVPPPAARRDLEGVLNSTANPAQVGQTATLNVAITNTTDAAVQNVQYRLRFPPQLRPQVIAGATQNQNALEFVPLSSLGPGETYRLSVPYTPAEQGLAPVQMDLRVGTGPVTTAETTISIRSR